MYITQLIHNTGTYSLQTATTNSKSSREQTATNIIYQDTQAEHEFQSTRQNGTSQTHDKHYNIRKKVTTIGPKNAS